MHPMDCLDRCFLDLDQRIPPGSVFCRLIGRDKAGKFLQFLNTYKPLAEKAGLYRDQPIPNPDEAAIDRFYAAVGQEFSPSVQTASRHLTIWLGQVRPARRGHVAAAVGEALERLKQSGANPHIVKNAYVKWMCWLRDYGGRALSHTDGKQPSKVLYQGQISKYEVYFLFILARSGCDVVYVNFLSEDSYRKTDREGAMSLLLKGEDCSPPPGAGTGAPKAQQAPYKPSLLETLECVKDTVLTNSWSKNSDFCETVLLPNNQRSGKDPPRLCNLFVLCFGVDQREAYRNRLYHMVRKLKETGARLLLVDRKLQNPANEEILPFKSNKLPADRAEMLDFLAQRLVVAGGETQKLLARRAFYLAMEKQKESNPNRLYNQGVRLACWLKRTADLLFEGYRAERQPVYVRYGPVTEPEITLLWMLQKMGVDVLYFSPEKEAAKIFEQHPLMPDGKRLDLPQSIPLEPFPEKETRVRVATVAYNASRELDQMLYSDTGMFRDRQFARSLPVTLKTTCDEIGILWNQEAKYRPSFRVEGGVVTVPNIFAKICGVDHGDLEAYWDRLHAMITEDTRLITQVPFSATGGSNLPARSLRGFVHNSRLDPVKIKSASIYRYDYLPEDVQDYILEKIQDVIDSSLLQNLGSEPETEILAVLLDLDKLLLGLLQNFDFTKAVPKVLLVDVTESLFSMENCIWLVFLNLVGFDIVIYTPTGYRNLEKYVTKEAYETYVAGEYQFNLTIPDLHNRKKSGSSDWLGKIFGRGR